jgi:hypothetical protein
MGFVDELMSVDNCRYIFRLLMLKITLHNLALRRATVAISDMMNYI